MKRKSPQEQFAERLRSLRTTKGLTQEALAIQAGRSRHYICEIEAGRRDPTLSTIVALADALGVPADELLRPAKK